MFSQIDEYAPNFSSSIIGHEVLTPPDLEKTFGLTGGVIYYDFLLILSKILRMRKETVLSCPSGRKQW